MVTMLQKELLLISYEIRALLKKVKQMQVHWKANKSIQGEGMVNILKQAFILKKYLMADSHVKVFYVFSDCWCGSICISLTHIVSISKWMFNS